MRTTAVQTVSPSNHVSPSKAESEREIERENCHVAVRYPVVGSNDADLQGERVINASGKLARFHLS